jgi:N-sulfoglucosamine sulfohydrolase
MATTSRPNVLILIPHDLGDHLNCYGHPTVRSPHINGFASEGIRLTNYYTSAPECTSSRSCMLTGLHSHQNGLMGLGGWGWELFPHVPHLAARLRDGGYSTHLFGMHHEGSGPAETLGYQHHVRSQGNRAADVCRNVVEFLKGPDARSEKPWFASAGFFNVHREWHNTPTFSPEEVDVPPYLPDNPTIRNDLIHFHQDILEMDAAVGSVLDELRDSDVGRNTIVIFTTDHGAPFPRAKASFYDPGIHIPLIMRWPGHIEGGRAFDQLLANVDFTPTILECCGLPEPDGLAGRSFLPLVEGREYAERDAVFGALFYDVSYDPMHYVRTCTHKYIRSFAVTPEEAAGADPGVLPVFTGGNWVRVDDLDVLSSPAWQSMACDCSKPPPEELYDLVADPLEQRNLADDPASAGVLGEMRKAMEEMMDRTASPLRNGGHVPPTAVQREKAAEAQPGGPTYLQTVATRNPDRKR